MFDWLFDTLLSGTYQKFTFFTLILIAFLLLGIIGLLWEILVALQKGNPTKDNDE